VNHPEPGLLRPTQSPNIILAVASVILGTVGLFGMIPTLLFTLCGVIPMGFGIAALITGILAKVRAKNDPQKWGGGGWAVGGMIAGVFCIIAPVLYIIIVMVFWFGLAAMSQPAR
jgi:hypothetical protein